MTDTQPQREFRLQGGSSIMNYVHRFSATEKAIFGLLCLVAAITALIMAFQVSNHYMVEIPASSGSLREGLVGLPHAINPVLAVSDIDRDISALVFSGLMRYSDGKLAPDLATSYTVSPDGLSYSFTIDPEAAFQDGKPVLAEDVAFTIQKVQDPALKSPRRSDWADISITVVSPREIKFTLKQPYSPFLSNTTLGIIPKSLWQDVTSDQFIFSRYNTEPIGSGPYKVSSIDRSSGEAPSQYRLSVWRGYHGEHPYLPTVIFKFYSDREKAIEALTKGDIDSLASISPEEAGGLSEDEAGGASSRTIISVPLPRIFGVFFNVNQSPVLADKSARQALSMSVDRQALVKQVLNGHGQPLYGPLPAGLATSTADSARADIAGARELLEKNSWKKNPSTGVYEKKNTKNVLQPLVFDIYTADSADLEKAAELVKNSWNELGAKVTVKIFDSTDLYQNIIRPRKYDALLFGELVGKDRDIYAFWHSSQVKAPGLNVATYTSAKADKLLEDIRVDTDEPARTAKYLELDATIRSDSPAAFLYSPDFIYAVPASLKGIDLKDVMVPSDRWNSIASWYVDTEKVWKVFVK